MSRDIINVPEIFGSDVFNEAVMKQRLEPDVYCAWKSCIQEGKPLELPVANAIAEAMKQWATEKGATHFTHWFQPMTGVTAEKHDGFIEPAADGKVIMSSPARIWSGASRTPPASPPVVCGPPSRPGAIRPGTPPLSPL